MADSSIETKRKEPKTVSTATWQLGIPWDQSDHYVSLAGRDVPEGGPMAYLEERPIGRSITDITSFLVSQASVTEDSWPEFMYWIHPPKEWRIFTYSARPSQKVDGNGQPMFERYPRVNKERRPILDYPGLPDTISSKEEWWWYVLWRRLDGRIRWEDIIMRQEPPGGAHTVRSEKDRVLSMVQKMTRSYQRYGMVSWFLSKANKATVSKRNTVLSSLTLWQIANNTTRGSTPGLIDPSKGEAGGIIPHRKLRSYTEQKRVADVHYREKRRQSVKSIREHKRKHAVLEVPDSISRPGSPNEPMMSSPTLSNYGNLSDCDENDKATIKARNRKASTGRNTSSLRRTEVKINENSGKIKLPSQKDHNPHRKMSIPQTIPSLDLNDINSSSEHPESLQSGSAIRHTQLASENPPIYRTQEPVQITRGFLGVIPMQPPTMTHRSFQQNLPVTRHSSALSLQSPANLGAQVNKDICPITATNSDDHFMLDEDQNVYERAPRRVHRTRYYLHTLTPIMNPYHDLQGQFQWQDHIQWQGEAEGQETFTSLAAGGCNALHHNNIPNHESFVPIQTEEGATANNSVPQHTEGEASGTHASTEPEDYFSLYTNENAFNSFPPNTQLETDIQVQNPEDDFTSYEQDRASALSSPNLFRYPPSPHVTTPVASDAETANEILFNRGVESWLNHPISEPMDMSDEDSPNSADYPIGYFE